MRLFVASNPYMCPRSNWIYDPKRHCPKCDYKEVDTRHEHWKDDDKTNVDELLRKCKRCGFGWYEIPLDYELPGNAKA